MGPSYQKKLQKLWRLDGQQVPLQADVADMVQHATELLQLTGPASEPATKMFYQMLSVTYDVEAAFTAALSLLDESLALAICRDKRITALEKEQARLETLAIFKHPIEAFCVCVAEKTGRATWQTLARDLYVEQYKQSKLARADVDSALSCMGLDLSVWDHVGQVAAAGNMKPQEGKDMHPRLLWSLVSSGALPQDFWSCNAAMTSMLDWLDNVM